MIRIDALSAVPIYEQIKRGLLKLIMLGAFSEEERLPSVRGLAREIAVNPNTVQRAYAELERDGVILTAPGRGNFLASKEALRTLLHTQLTGGLREAAGAAKNGGIPIDEALEAIRQAYKEDGVYD